jgi:hypothetical protein
VATLHEYLHERFPFDWTITIADNASTDRTPVLAGEAARWCPRIRTLRFDRVGKGGALRSVWSSSRADVVAYMDVDLSSGLDALLALVAPLCNGHSDIAIGSRLAPGARTIRGLKRELISRGYNAALRLVLGARFSDAQCGFKAARAEVIQPLLRLIEDDSWFFDTELLLLAEHNGLRVHEVAVDWVEDVDSRVDIVSTAVGDLRGMARLALAKVSGAASVAGLPMRPPPRAAHPDAVLARSRFPAGWRMPPSLVAVLAVTVALGLYTLLRLWWPPLAADVGAITLTAWLSAKATRWPAFSAARRPGRRQLTSLLAFGLGYPLSCGALLVLDVAVHRPGRLLELAALCGAAVAGVAVLAALAHLQGARWQPKGQWDPVIIWEADPGAPGDPASAVPEPDSAKELSA